MVAIHSRVPFISFIWAEQASRVEPVVITSSTSKMFLLRKTSGFFILKTLSTFSQRLNRAFRV
jgi:hypothetical protein